MGDISSTAATISKSYSFEPSLSLISLVIPIAVGPLSATTLTGALSGSVFPGALSVVLSVLSDALLSGVELLSDVDELLSEPVFPESEPLSEQAANVRHIAAASTLDKIFFSFIVTFLSPHLIGARRIKNAPRKTHRKRGITAVYSFGVLSAQCKILPSVKNPQEHIPSGVPWVCFFLADIL